MKVACLLVLLASVVLLPLEARGQWVLERSWGTKGTGPGQFDRAMFVAVGPNEIVYVSDIGNSRVQAFSRDGEYLFEWGSEGSGDGQFLETEGIGIDDQGVVFVADNRNCRVQQFTLAGEFLSAWPSRCGQGPGELVLPRDLVAHEGIVFVIAHNYPIGYPSIHKFTQAGEFIFQIPADGGYSGIARAADGTLWATVEGLGLVRHFGLDGDFLGEWSALPPGYKYALPLGIDLDSQGNLFIANGLLGTIEKFAPDGTHLETISAAFPRSLALASDFEMYVLNGVQVMRFVQPVALEPTTWGRVKAAAREFGRDH